MKKKIGLLLGIIALISLTMFLTYRMTERKLEAEHARAELAASQEASVVESYLAQKEAEASQEDSFDALQDLIKPQEKKPIDEASIYAEKVLSDVMFSLQTDDRTMQMILDMDHLFIGEAGSSLKLLSAARDFLVLAVDNDASIAVVESCLDQMNEVQLDFFSFQIHRVFFEALRVIGRDSDTLQLWDGVSEREDWMDCSGAQAVLFMSHIVHLLEMHGVQNEWEVYDLSPLF